MSRIYKVNICHPLEPHIVIGQSLIAAISPGKAQQHVAKKFINAKLATPTDVAELMGRGLKVEDGTEPEKPSPPIQAEASVGDQEGQTPTSEPVAPEPVAYCQVVVTEEPPHD